jgi:energy-coupling factor transport system substrate-specific component
VILLLVCVLGLALYLWPFLGVGVPAATPALAIGLGAVAGLLCLELGTRRMDSRQLALLAALSAADAALRAALVTGIGGFSPIFLLVLCGGYALGPTFGFLVGATSLLVSALVTGGMGPWVPYQLFAVGWVGMAAGLVGMLRSGRRPTWVDVGILSVVGAAAGFGFGAVMDVWNWTFYPSVPQLGWSATLPPLTGIAHFARYYLVTSSGYDTFRAVGNVLMIAVFGLPVLAGLRRLSRRFQIHWPSGGAEPAAASVASPESG